MRVGFATSAAAFFRSPSHGRPQYGERRGLPPPVCFYNHAMRPFALHITWTTYGTWLPGDERGHVSNIILPAGGFIRADDTPGAPIPSGDEFTRQRAADLQKGDTVWLTAAQALSACQAIAAAASKRGWLVVRAGAMANHLHNVVMNCPDDGPLVRRILKGTSQAALNDLAGRNQRWFSAGGSDRYKHGDEAIANAVNYVARQAFQLARIIDNVASLVEDIRRG
jgi:REP element-mobilizing transposase RayT